MGVIKFPHFVKFTVFCSSQGEQWREKIDLLLTLPHYISPSSVQRVILAGKQSEKSTSEYQIKY